MNGAALPFWRRALPPLPAARRLACAAIASAIVCIVLSAACTLAYLRHQAEARVAATTENLARSLVLTFDGIIDAIDLSLQASADEIARQRAGARPDAAAIDAFLLRQQGRLGARPILRATDADGRIVHGAGADRDLRLAGRPYFEALRAPGARLQLSAPIPGGPAGKWIWVLARPIHRSDGSADGAVTAVLALDQVVRIMEHIHLDEGGSIVLRNARFEAIGARLGAPAASPPTPGDTRLSPELRAALSADPQRGTYRTSASVLAVDGVHTFSYERSAKHGFYVWVGEADRVGLAEWRRQLWVIASLTAAFAVLAGALLLLMRRAWRRQARDLDEIRRLAYYDGLTGLPNRRLLLDRLAQAMSARAGRRCSGALLVIDLDHFKNLNDMHGHERGDLMLRQVAQRLRASVPASITVARLGGDEFALLATALPRGGAAARAQAAMIGDLLGEALAAPFALDGYQYAGSASIGIALFSGGGRNTDELVKHAETAMYQAKAAGRRSVRFFDPGMQAALAARLALERDLRQALAAQQFALHYQVQVDAAGQARGAEALLRWAHPERGMVPPGAFIALAEESGLIVPLGQWVLHTACEQLARWARDPVCAHLTLAVNVSACQFSQPRFVAQVIDVLAATGADPRRLKLELTEGLLLENTESVIGAITALKCAGVGIALDDFGTGYSSLSYLKRLPLDQLKIDQAFVRDLLTDPSDGAIVRAIVALGQSLGLDVIAEGVETEAQRGALAAAGCLAYQGYLFGRPLPAGQFNAALWRERAALATG